MIRLTLVRHAHAAGKTSRIDDFDRVLTQHGRVQARNLGRELARQQWIPQRLLASAAQRVKETTRILAQELQLAPASADYDRKLYLARPEELLEVIHSVGPQATHLAIVGHNPGLSELVFTLAPGKYSSELATAEACSMAFDAADWSRVGTLRAASVDRVLPSAIHAP